MDNLSNMIWIELRKAVRSRMPLWTALASMFMPIGIAFLIFVSRNPQVSQKLGLISAKANLVAYSGADWSTYLNMFGLLISAGGLIVFIFVISWVFGREFIDGTIKDMLAVPVERSRIILAKFIVVAIWCAALTVLIYLAGVGMGALIRLPGGSAGIIFHGGLIVLAAGLLSIVVATPFALFASIGRGYLLPIGLAVVTLMMTNLVAVIGRAEYFPWAVPGLFAEAKTPLAPVSYWIAFLTGLAGIFATYLWWKYEDQNR